MLNFKNFPSPLNDYFQEKFTKDLLILHFTAGYTSMSARASLRNPDYVAVPFIVDVDGTVNLCFPKEYWAYHLGVKGASNPGHALDKRTIALEIVNIGPVWLRDGKWYDYVGREWPAENVVAVPDRDAGGAVKFPRVQVDAVCELVNDILTKVPTIPRQIPKDVFSCQLPALQAFKGVGTHQMFRQDKYDLGPAFPYADLISRCSLKIV